MEVEPQLPLAPSTVARSASQPSKKVPAALVAKKAKPATFVDSDSEVSEAGADDIGGADLQELLMRTLITDRKAKKKTADGTGATEVGGADTKLAKARKRHEQNGALLRQHVENQVRTFMGQAELPDEPALPAEKTRWVEYYRMHCPELRHMYWSGLVVDLLVQLMEESPPPASRGCSHRACCLSSRQCEMGGARKVWS